MKKWFIENLLPDYRFSNLTDISADFFSNSDLIIFDADNTLVFPETAETKKEIIDWFYKINSRHKCILISNSRTIFERKDKISALLKCDVFLSHNKKPFRKLFQELKKKYNFEDSRVFVAGDKIFTDILFGNLNGAKTILVKPLGRK
ncbi:MAG: HAD superfamily hydrolase IIIA phosphatase [Parcubacteria group bacterium Licking1014_1]|nr:MAG: HAD superfamily hydrolase IIIA phosphatase [Parcubacteria group bacterium Licking1014_1]